MGNFSDLMFILNDWVEKYYSSTSESWDKIIQRPQRASRYYIELSNSIFTVQSTNNRSLTGKTVFDFKAYQNAITTAIPLWNKSNIDALDFVVVKFKDDITIGTYIFKAGETRKITAMMCHWIIREVGKQSAARLGKYTLYSLGSVIGVSQIAAAQTGIELSIAIIDMGILSADFTMNEILANKLNQTVEGRKFLDDFNKFVLIYGGVRVFAELTGLAKKLRTKGKILTNPNDVLTDTQITELNTTVKTAEIKAGITPEVIIFDIDKVNSLQRF